MIEINKVSKIFDKIEAVKEISLSIQSQNVFGMLGTNGAGKSTLLRMMAGVLKTDEGEIFIDGLPVWDNPRAKELCFYISDEQFFYPNASAADMERFYTRYYPGFDRRRYIELLERFGLLKERKIQTYSKGMKKQLSILLGLCTNVPYIFCDETFDGLDPVMRQGIKAIFTKEIKARPLTLVVASHNLRELEDICDHIGLLHKGGVLLSRELEDLKCNLHKIQCVPAEGMENSFHEIFDITNFEQHGRLVLMTVRGEKEEILKKMESMNTVYYEALPLSLEEIFISETEVAGYDIKTLIL